MKKALKITLIVLLTLLILGSLFLIIFINNIMGISSVKFDKEKLISTHYETVVFDANNNEIENTVEPKKVVSIDEMPENLINAFVSIEDKQFFSHNGLNYKRIAKAMFNNLKNFSFVEGASTISQQLIKNTHLSNEKTIKRKIKEMLLTKKLEKEFTKKDILETYLNIIYFGENSYGVERASNTYFNKSVRDLSLAQCATLAGIIKSPLKYSPVYNYENCLTRRNLVLKEMLKDEKITTSQYENAISEPLEIVSQDKDNLGINNLYVNASLLEAQELLGFSENELRLSNYKIYTYYDSDKQTALYNAANNDDNYHINSYGNVSDSLMILIDNNSLGVNAFYGKSKYNLTNFVRQPGSTIKPILVYAPALESGLINPSTKLLDEETSFNGYTPNNVGGVFHGNVTVSESIAKSLNIPAVKTLEYVGIDKAKNFAKHAGIEFDKEDNGLAIALGGFTTGVTLKDLTNSFIPFVNSGYYAKANFIRKITDNLGRTIYEHKPNKEQIMGDDTAYLMTKMLSDACDNGTSMRLRTLPFQVAGKTGTVAIKGTNNNTDAYSVAYTREHTMGVWMGNYANDKEHILEGKNNGGTFATSVIKQCFSEIYKDNKPSNFIMPDSVKEIEIDGKLYEDENIIKLASKNCPERYRLKILVSKRFEPKEVSDLFDNLSIKNFDVKVNKLTAIVSFEAKDYLKYELYKVSGNTTKVIANYSNKEGMQEFIDKNLDYGTKYGYYLKVSTINESTQTFSNTITILTDSFESSFDKIINNDLDANTWLFRWSYL